MKSNQASESGCLARIPLLHQLTISKDQTACEFFSCMEGEYCFKNFPTPSSLRSGIPEFFTLN